MIQIIDKLQLTKDGLFVKGTKQEIHLQQGALDGACAVYSMMMCLIIAKAIKRNEVTNLDFSPDGRSSKGILVRLFLENQGLIRKGYFFPPLQADLDFSFKKQVNTWCRVSKSLASSPDFELKKAEISQCLSDDIIEALDNNVPVMIGFTRKGNQSGHAVVVIGYQMQNDNIKLFCLDPGYPLFEGQIWNNIIQVDKNSSSKYNCINYNENYRVAIDEILVIERKP